MAQNTWQSILRYLSRSVRPGGSADQTDGELLERFMLQREEAAFAALVSRHGSMVFGVCRRVLGDTDDAEDAFQAAFLILYRKATALGKPASLRNWLYTVAVRVAQRARASAARRREQERQAVVPTEMHEPSDASDMRQALDEELCRLPAKYREPLLLCYLEGKSNEEAAAELRCPVGTIWTRLSRGRDLLHDRLLRRGVTLSLGMVTGALAEQGRAAVPGALADATIRAVARCALGEMPTAAGFSSHVLALADGALHTMWLAQARVVAVVAMALLVVVGSGWVVHAAIAGKSEQRLAHSPATTTNEPDNLVAVPGNVALAANGVLLHGVEHGAVHLNDGRVTGLQRYASSPWPCEWIVELPRVYPLTTVRLLLWDGTDRYYRYVLEGSADGVTYEVLADRSTGKWRSWQTIAFDVRPIKFLKIRGLYNSERDTFHLKELEAYCLPPEDTVTPAFPSEP